MLAFADESMVAALSGTAVLRDRLKRVARRSLQAKLRFHVVYSQGNKCFILSHRDMCFLLAGKPIRLRHRIDLEGIVHRYFVSLFVLVGKLMLPPAGPVLGTVPALLKDYSE